MSSFQLPGGCPFDLEAKVDRWRDLRRKRRRELEGETTPPRAMRILLTSPEGAQKCLLDTTKGSASEVKSRKRSRRGRRGQARCRSRVDDSPMSLVITLPCRGRRKRRAAEMSSPAPRRSECRRPEALDTTLPTCPHPVLDSPAPSQPGCGSRGVKRRRVRGFVPIGANPLTRSSPTMEVAG